MWASAVLLALSVPAFAQSGVNGLNTATSTLKTYVGPVTNITLVIGGIVGIVGAIRVYSKWNSGDQDIWERYRSHYYFCYRQCAFRFCQEQGDFGMARTPLWQIQTAW